MMRSSAPIRQDEQNHWDGVAAASPDEPTLWREQSDVVKRLLIDRWLPTPAGRILKTDLFDEAVGTGLYPALQARGQVMGMDISSGTVSRARARYPEMECVAGDVRQVPVADGCFDAVVSNSTLDHLTDEEEATAALGELRRVLRPGGRLILTLDNPRNPLIALRNRLPAGMARSLRGVPYDAGWTCGPGRLRVLLAGAGLEPRETTAVLHLPRVLVAQLGDRGIGREARWRSMMRAGERLERLPTRYLTGHFIAALATRAAAPDDDDRSALRA